MFQVSSSKYQTLLNTFLPAVSRTIEIDAWSLFFLTFLPMPSPIGFLRETQDELKKVVWPTRQEVIRLTVVVIAISVVIGLYIGGLDLVFSKLVELVIK